MQHDHALRRKAHRKGRELGCHVYITSDDLLAAGIDPKSAPPYYKVWAGKRGRFIITMYGER